MMKMMIMTMTTVEIVTTFSNDKLELCEKKSA